MRATVFSAGSAKELDDALAAWLEASPGVVVAVATQSQSPVFGFGGQTTGVLITLTVFYHAR